MRARHPVVAALALLAVCCAGCGGDAGVDSGGSGSATPAASGTASASASDDSPTSPAAATSACLRSDGNCLGVLAPGDYSSTAFAAFGSAGEGQLTYSVDDDAWANALDHAAGYWFQTADAYAGSDGDSTLEGVYLFADAAAAKQDYPGCTEESDPSVRTDAASILRWIRTLPDLRTAPAPDLVTASGRAPGIRITTRPGALGKCYDGATVRTFVASRAGAIDPYVWGITGTEAIEAHFEDLGDHTVAILLYAPDGVLSPRFTRRARHLASTFTFTAPTG